MDIIKVINIIEDNIAIFLQEIKRKCQIDCKMLHIYKSDFPIFRPANQEFFEYVFYEGILEWYIRDYLVTPIICGLFTENGTNILIPNVDDAPIVAHFSYSNDQYAKDYPFAFIIKKCDESIAICYASPDFDNNELNQLFKLHSLNHIEIIDWSDTNEIHSPKNAWSILPESRNCVYFVTLHEFFLKYFSEEIYNVFLWKIRKAVEEANKEIGLNTISNLSLKYLSDFKSTILYELSNISIESIKYQQFDTQGEPSEHYYEFLPEEDYKIINKRLITDELMISLVGNENFAKCFLTSEYLFYVFKNGNENYFDYSAVATGYFKAVELLLKKIMDLALNCNGHENLWIKCNKCIKNKDIDDVKYRYNPNRNAKGTQVRFLKENELEFSTEMGPLIWFLHDRTNGWNISKEGVNVVHKCLINYNQGCRNEHLHKDVIDDIDSIMLIRKNTIICLFYLLGGCQLTDSPEYDKKSFGCVSDSYDRLYKKLNDVPRGVNCFFIKFSGKEPIKAIRLYEQESPRYDSQGNIQSQIVFVKVYDFHIDDYEKFVNKVENDNRIFLNRNNIPEKIWWYNEQKGQVEITW